MKKEIKNKIFEEILWGLDRSEDLNVIESYYIDFLIKLSERKLKRKLNKILDIPCGIGRHHKYLRELGYDVFGADINLTFIEECKERFPEFGDKYFVKDMKEINFENGFDVILNWFNSFSYFSHEENFKVLNNFYRALGNNSLLILNTTTAGFIENKLTIKHIIENEFSINNEKYVLITNIANIEKLEYGYKMNIIRSIYKEQNRDLVFVKSLNVKQILYYPKFIVDMIKNSGFEILFVFPGNSITNYTNDVERLNKYPSITVVAKK